MRRFFFISLLFVQNIVCAQQEGFVDGNDSRIFYRIFGQGKPLLIINGGPGMNSDGFIGLARTLSPNAKIILYDQRGTGKSTLPKTNASTITMKLMIEDLEHLRNYLHIDQWIVLGHSFGGMLAAYYATLYPQHIKAMIFSSSGGIDLELQSYVGKNLNARLTRQERDSVQYWNQKISEGDTSYFARLRRGLALAPAYVYDRKNISVIAERLTQSNGLVNSLVWQNLQKIKFDCSSALRLFTKPVLIIQGKQDIVEYKTAMKAHQVLKQSEVVIMDHCVHYGWLDRPDEYIQTIERFIAEN